MQTRLSVSDDKGTSPHRGTGKGQVGGEFMPPLQKEIYALLLGR